MFIGAAVIGATGVSEAEESRNVRARKPSHPQLDFFESNEFISLVWQNSSDIHSDNSERLVQPNLKTSQD